MAGILFLLLSYSWADSSLELINVILRVSYILIFCLGGYLLNPTRAWLKGYLSYGLPLAAIVLLESLGHAPVHTDVVATLLVMALQMHIFQAIFGHILFDVKTTPINKILGGICGYLLLGLLFSNIYTVILIFNPEAISVHKNAAVGHAELIYYSLVTLTTVGYGDIVAISSTARMVSALEAVAGNLYLAILISTLASQYLFKNSTREEKHH